MTGPQHPLDALLRRACDEGVTPGCVGVVWRAGAIAWSGAAGVLADAPGLRTPTTLDTHYDLASLTKVLCTTTLCAQAVSAGQMRLDEPIPASLGLADGARPALRDLLEHAAGLEAHREFFHAPWELNAGQREAMIRAVREVPRACPPRTRAIYSDLGFLLLGAWLERLFDERLDVAFRRRVAEPLGLASTLGFRPLDETSVDETSAPTIAPTERYDDPDRHWSRLRESLGQAVAHGIVHDDNCVIMRGVAGHAGLFGTATAVATLGAAWARAALPGVSPQIVARFRRASTVPGSSRRLGFDGPTPGGSTGEALGPDAYGHLGFTGTSMWIDPSSPHPSSPHPSTAPNARTADPAVYVLLSNRVSPDREHAAVTIRSLRREFHRLAARAD